MSTTTSTPADLASAPVRTKAKPRPRAAHLSVPALLLLLALTVIYLILELGFNAYVLQSVGEPLSQHTMDRMLLRACFVSGGAIGLLALHVMLRLRVRSQQRTGEARPDSISVVLYMALAISCTASLMLSTVERVVEELPVEFRKQALNINLMQSASAGKVLKWASQEDPELFTTAAGKTFLAYYPFMTAARDTLGTEVQPLVKYHAQQTAVKQVGGISGHYEAYKRAIETVSKDYDLYHMRGRRKNAEYPQGLTLQQYLGHKNSQAKLRRLMKLPESMSVPYVTTEEAFRAQMFEPMIRARVQASVSVFSAPIASFADTRGNAQIGLEATSRTLLPGWLLMTSMAGLLVHFALLIYLVVQLCLVPVRSRFAQRRGLQWLTGPGAALVPVAVVLVMWGAMNAASNDMTRSTPYQDMSKYLSAENPKNLPLTGWVNASLHAMTVGEAWLAPLGHRIHGALQTKVPQLFPQNH